MQFLRNNDFRSRIAPRRKSPADQGQHLNVNLVRQKHSKARPFDRHRSENWRSGPPSESSSLHGTRTEMIVSGGSMDEPRYRLALDVRVLGQLERVLNVRFAPIVLINSRL